MRDINELPRQAAILFEDLHRPLVEVEFVVGALDSCRHLKLGRGQLREFGTTVFLPSRNAR